jgi:hypothetical protein
MITFWLGRVVEQYEIGAYRIVEYAPRDGGANGFAAFIDGRDIGQSWPTLERAIVGVIAYQYDGPNSQAGEFFARMVGLPAGEDAA